nr:helix-turn-helix domain-containing protein [Paracoccus saliphilus]
MKQTHDYNLTVKAVADHYSLTPGTVRAKLRAGELEGVRIGGDWRCSWQNVWAAEQGPVPRGNRADAYKKPLLTKKDLGAQWSVSERTVERWIAAGLPTRNVFGSVRIAPAEADEWVRRTFQVGEKVA